MATGSTTSVCCHDMLHNDRNLVMCIDDAELSPSNRNTTTVRGVFHSLEKHLPEHQLVYYDPGVGRDYVLHGIFHKALKFVQRVIGVLCTRNSDLIVQSAYIWLSQNYSAGDRIFCFGFARGAFEVRALSAMIEKVGLIPKGNEALVPIAYGLYRTAYRNPDKTSMCNTFKRAFSQSNVKVHFVGAWDTVSGVGDENLSNLAFPGVAEGMEHVCYFRHALALDECHNVFLPLYSCGTSTEGNKASWRHISNSLISWPRTVEVWFSGNHAEIGGISTSEIHPSLPWMIFDATRFGLRAVLGHERSFNANAKVSRIKRIWWMYEILPLKRWTYMSTLMGKKSTLMPHLWAGRVIDHGQKLHFSVLQALQVTDYLPKAHFPSDITWEWASFSTTANFDEWVVSNPDELLKPLISKFVLENDNNAWDAVSRLAISDVGRQAIYEGVMHFITAANRQHTSNDHNGSQLIRKARALLKDHKKRLQMQYASKVEQVGLRNEPITVYEKEKRRFLDEFTTYKYLVLKDCRSPVYSFTISEDGRKIISGFENGTLLHWDASTGGKTKEHFVGHGKPTVNCFALSLQNEICIASAATESTLGIWTDTTITQAIDHQDFISTLSFSPDGKRLVTGAGDKILRIWDVETGNMIGERMQGHSDTVLAASFSPLGGHIVSGSADKTVRIWDVSAHKQIGLPWKGHRHWVHCVTFSPDGSTVASGSADCTIRIWNVETGQQVGQPFEGHESTVNCISFSPDGRRIVSGSSDRTVRIWDVQSGKQIGKSLRGHRRAVNCICFSSDGIRVISGSNDWTLRIWDIL